MHRVGVFHIVVVAALLPGSALAQFVLDQTPKQLREAQGRLAIEDLAIEETGLTAGGDFCTENDELFVRRSSLLASEKLTYGVNFRITRKQGDAVTIEAVPGEKLESLRDSMLTTFRVASQLKCHVFNIDPASRFKVRSVNGSKSLSDLLGKLK